MYGELSAVDHKYCQGERGTEMLQRVRAPMRFELELCPRCWKKLGKTAVIKRSTLKIFKCKNCGTVINERMVIR